MADETRISVLTKDKPGATHKGYYWVYYDPVNKLAVFDYQKSRGQEGPNGMLEAFDGHLQTDGYVAYTSLKNKDIILLACMAHARRKFEHAKDNDRVRAEHALAMFHQLYQIEAEIREQLLSPDEIKAIRMERALPVLLEMEAWLKKEIYLVLPKSAIGMAFSYTLNLWPRLGATLKMAVSLSTITLSKTASVPLLWAERTTSLPDRTKQQNKLP
jgi:hypothetical protein